MTASAARPRRATGPAHWFADPRSLARAARLPAAAPRDLLGRAAFAAAEALFATDAGPPPAERLVWLVTELRAHLGPIGLRSRAVVLASLAAATVLAPWLAGRVGPLERLPVSERVAALERLERSPLGLSVFALKATLAILYFEHPDAAAEIGFDGRGLGRRGAGA